MTKQGILLISLFPCQNILDEKYEDVLVNVNIMDTERTKKNFENLKSHAGYNAYDQEQVDENTGIVYIGQSKIIQLCIHLFLLIKGTKNKLSL